MTKAEIIKEISNKVVEDIPWIQNTYGISYEEAKDIYYENLIDISNNYLIDVVNKVTNYGMTDDSEEIYEELDLIIKSGSSIVFVLAYRIATFLKSKNEYYCFSSCLTSSYLAYTLGIHNVNCLKYNNRHELCHGINSKKRYSLCFDISMNIFDDLNNYLDSIYPDRLAYINNSFWKMDKQFRALIIDDYLASKIEENKPKFRVLKEDDPDINYKVIPLYIIISADVTLINEMKRKLNINIDDTIFNNDKITNFLINSSIDLNDKRYLTILDEDRINETIEILKPRSFNDLIKIIGIKYDNGLWEGNQKEKYINHEIDEVFTSKEDVIEYLIKFGYSYHDAFVLIKKAIGPTNKIYLYENELLDRGVPYSIIDILSKIKYLPSRASSISFLQLIYILEYLKEKDEELFFKLY